MWRDLAVAVAVARREQGGRLDVARLATGKGDRRAVALLQRGRCATIRVAATETALATTSALAVALTVDVEAGFRVTVLRLGLGLIVDTVAEIVIHVSCLAGGALLAVARFSAALGLAAPVAPLAVLRLSLASGPALALTLLSLSLPLALPLRAGLLALALALSLSLFLALRLALALALFLSLTLLLTLALRLTLALPLAAVTAAVVGAARFAGRALVALGGGC